MNAIKIRANSAENFDTRHYFDAESCKNLKDNTS